MRKVIKTIWICRKLLEQSKPCNEMEIFKTFVNQRIKMEHFVASEKKGKRENFLSYQARRKRGGGGGLPPPPQ